MDFTTCFAWTPSGECMAFYTGMHKNRCPRSADCKFFKSAKEQAVSEKSKMKRLATLLMEQQWYIADKYYFGDMPWSDAAPSR